MLYAREAKGSVAETVQRVEAAAVAHQFGVMGVYDLKEKMADKGIAFTPECRIVEVCQPAQAKKVLEGNIAIATALPCRIAVYEDHGKVIMATLLPSVLLGMFDSTTLAPIAQQVEDTIKQIMDDATG